MPCERPICHLLTDLEQESCFARVAALLCESVLERLGLKEVMEQRDDVGESFMKAAGIVTCRQ
jgi:hypothetical protein